MTPRPNRRPNGLTLSGERQKLISKFSASDHEAIVRVCDELETTVSQFIAELVIPDAAKVNADFPAGENISGRKLWRRPTLKNPIRVVSYVSTPEKLAIRAAHKRLGMGESNYVASVVIPEVRKLKGKLGL